MSKVFVIHRTDDTIGHRWVRPNQLAPFDPAVWLINPDLTAVRGSPERHWTVDGDSVVLKVQAERDAADQAFTTARRDAVAQKIDQTDDLLRAVALTLLQRDNQIADAVDEILTAFDQATSLADLKTRVAAIAKPLTGITASQFRDAVRNKLDE